MDHFSIDPEGILRVPRSPPSAKSDATWIAERIELLLSAYRRDDYADPVKFVAQLGAVLEAYDSEIIQFVTDPRTGIQRRVKFPPSIAEVVEACQAESVHREKMKKYAALPPPVPRLPRPRYSATDNYEAMFAKYGRPVGFFEDVRDKWNRKSKGS